MIAWNDRRKAKKAARATTRLQIQQMAKTGAIKALTPPSKDKWEAAAQKDANKAERQEVLGSAYRVRSDYNYRHEMAGSDKRMSKRESIDQAAYVNDLKRKNEGKK